MVSRNDHTLLIDIPSELLSSLQTRRRGESSCVRRGSELVRLQRRCSRPVHSVTTTSTSTTGRRQHQRWSRRECGSDHGSGDESGEDEVADGDDEKYLGYSAQKLALAKEQFTHYDADASGSINTTELHKLFANLGEQLTLASVQELIKAVDTDGNGEVDFDEFLHLLRKQ